MVGSQQDLQRHMARLVETCRRNGLRLTHQRVEVYRECAAGHGHPDAETVFQQVRKRVTGISRDTVYRTLATLEREGLIRRTGVLGGPARYDANLDRHHHFVCTVCGRVKDFTCDALDDLPLPKAVAAFGRIETAQVQVRGVCTLCARKNVKTRRRSPA